jgi:hypothetical protein
MRLQSNIRLQDNPSKYKYNQSVLRTYIEHGADCLEIYVLFIKWYNRNSFEFLERV